MADSKYMGFMEEVISSGASDFILKPVLQSQITTLPSHVYKKNLQLKQQQQQEEVQQQVKKSQQQKFQQQLYMQNITHQLDQSKKFERAEQNYGHKGSNMTPYPVYNERGASNAPQTLNSKRQEGKRNDKGNDNSWESSQYFVNPQTLRNINTAHELNNSSLQFEQLAQSHEQNDESIQDDRQAPQKEQSQAYFGNKISNDPYKDFMDLLVQAKQFQQDSEQPASQAQPLPYWNLESKNGDSNNFSPFQSNMASNNQNQPPLAMDLLHQLAQTFEDQQKQWNGDVQKLPQELIQQANRNIQELPSQNIRQKRQRSLLPQELEQTVTSSEQAQQTRTNRSLDKPVDYQKNANILPKVRHVEVDGLRFDICKFSFIITTRDKNQQETLHAVENLPGRHNAFIHIQIIKQGGIQELIRQTERKLSGNHDFEMQSNTHDINSVQKSQRTQSRQFASQGPEASMYQNGAFKIARNFNHSKLQPSTTGFQNTTYQSGEHSSSSDRQLSTQHSNRQAGSQATAQDLLKQLQGMSQQEMMESGMHSMGQFIFASMQQNFNNAIEEMSKNNQTVENKSKAAMDNENLRNMFPQLAMLHEQVQQMGQSQRIKQIEEKEKVQSANLVQGVDQEMNGEVMAELRKVALQKYLQKRKRRTYDKKVRYESRRTLAVNRPRVRGQFVKIDDLAKMQVEDSERNGQTEKTSQLYDNDITVAS